MDVTYIPLSTGYLAMIVILGSFFSMNLILAVIIQAFKQISKKEEELSEERIREKETKFKKLEALKFLMRLKTRALE